jgi:hypothetical protein
MNRLQELYNKWFKTLEDAGTTFALIGVVCGGLGSFLELQFLFNIGLASFGAAVVAWGVNAIQRGEMTPIERGFRVMDHVEGFFARAWGLLLALGGFLLFGYGILSLINPRSPIPTSIRPIFQGTQGAGVFLIIGGAIGMLFALTTIFVSDVQASNIYVRFIKSIPGRLVGVVLLLFFGVLTLAGLIQVFSPAAWEPILEFVRQKLEQVLLG